MRMNRGDGRACVRGALVMAWLASLSCWSCGEGPGDVNTNEPAPGSSPGFALQTLLHCPPGEAPQCVRIRGKLTCTCEPIAPPPPPPKAVELTSGPAFHFARKDDGTVYAWGQDSSGVGDPGRFGDGLGDSIAPRRVATLTNVVQIAAGFNFSCALLSDATVSCWGDFGPLSPLGTSATATTPLAISGLNSVTQIAAGFQHACAVRSDHTAWCWGAGISGDLGNGTAVDYGTLTPQRVSGLSDVEEVVAGQWLSCARRTGGAVACWGSNYQGGLGNGNGHTGGDPTRDSAVPVAVLGASSTVRLFANDSTVAALQSDGAVYVWGDNSSGIYGNGTTVPSYVPALVPSLFGARHLALGAPRSACGVFSDGSSRCWGKNHVGQLGDGTLADHLTPSPLASTEVFLSMTTEGETSCGVTGAGDVDCWGSNYKGELGSGIPSGRPELEDSPHPLPTRVPAF